MLIDKEGGTFFPNLTIKAIPDYYELLDMWQSFLKDTLFLPNRYLLCESLFILPQCTSLKDMTKEKYTRYIAKVCFSGCTICP